MPILGIVASSITGNLVTNSYASIATITVGSGGTSVINFTSIPATYTHLQIRAIGRMTNAGSSTSSLSIRVNSDSGANYANHRILGENATVYAQGGGSSTDFSNLGQWPLASSPANVFGATIIDILDYANTNKYKTFRSINGAEGNNSGQSDIALGSGLWTSTSAITSIQITGPAYSGGLAQYSSFALYGIKGA